MPLEGHWARTHTPTASLGRGERRLVGLAVALALVAVVAMAAMIALSSGASRAAPGCVEATVASTTGGAQFHACGDGAKAFCAGAAGEPGHQGAEARAACRRAGI
jgi:hypothetical protein